MHSLSIVYLRSLRIAFDFLVQMSDDQTTLPGLGHVVNQVKTAGGKKYRIQIQLGEKD